MISSDSEVELPLSTLASTSKPATPTGPTTKSGPSSSPTKSPSGSLPIGSSVGAGKPVESAVNVKASEAEVAGDVEISDSDDDLPLVQMQNKVKDQVEKDDSSKVKKENTTQPVDKFAVRSCFHFAMQILIVM